MHNSDHFGSPLPFWAPGPPALPGLPMASCAAALWRRQIPTDGRTGGRTDRQTAGRRIEAYRWRNVAYRGIDFIFYNFQGIQARTGL